MKAVIDTNVLVSALLAKTPASPTVRILRAIVEGRFTPLYAMGRFEKIVSGAITGSQCSPESALTGRD